MAPAFGIIRQGEEPLAHQREVQVVHYAEHPESARGGIPLQVCQYRLEGMVIQVEDPWW